MEKVTNLKSEPVIGKFYLVPCVNVRGNWFPVVGDIHSDVELGVKEQHWHHDLRFLHPQLLSDALPNYPYTREEISMFKITYGVPEPVLRKMKCRRRMPVFGEGQKRDPYLKMHKKYLGREIKCGRCPHRNMPLESLPQDEHGVVICNGHGLAASLRTNRIVERFK